jgi:hypothetical protein
MLIADTGPLVAMLNAKAKHPQGLHRAVPAIPRPDRRPGPDRH